MEIMEQAIEKILRHWEKQGISSEGKTLQDIEALEKALNNKLPQDFKLYFSKINGMGSGYLNDTDENGFSFYPLEQLRVIEEEFNPSIDKNKRCILFADYLQNCWSYVILVDDFVNENQYSILGYIDCNQYKIITNSLAEFIDFYLSDSKTLYDF